MPCPCNDKNDGSVQTGGAHHFNPHLDAAENELHVAIINEIPTDHKQYMPQILEIIRLLKGGTRQANRPLIQKLINNTQATNDTINEIPCRYCRTSSQHFANASNVHMIEFEKYNMTGQKIHLWHALWFMWKETGLGYWWLLLALIMRLIIPNLRKIMRR